MKALSREEKRRELHELPDENGDASPKDASPKDVWSAQCDDDCPQCGARHMSPYDSEDVEESEHE